MFKKIIFLLLAVLTALTLMSAVSVTAGADEIPTLLYEVQSDGTIWITGLNPMITPPEILNIPSKIDGYTVSGIDQMAFADCGFTYVSIPETVTQIGMMAFYGCISLETLVLREGLQHIEHYAFENCIALKNVTIPKSVTYLGVCSFGYVAYDDGNGNFTDKLLNGFSMKVRKGSVAENYAMIYNVSYSYPISMTDDFYYTLNMDDTIIILLGQSDVTELVIPAEINGVPVTAIDKGAFRYNTALTTAVIPSTVKSIGNMAFYGCYNLSSLTLNEGLEVIYGYAFENCYSLASITIPRSVNEFGYYSFGSYDSVETDDQGAQYYADNYYEESTGFVAYVYKGSGAEQFVQNQGIPYRYISLLGDVDSSGNVDVVDATFLQRYATEITTPFDEGIVLCGDIDHNGSPDIVDATFVQRHATEIKTPYPIGERIAA